MAQSAVGDAGSQTETGSFTRPGRRVCQISKAKMVAEAARKMSLEARQRVKVLGKVPGLMVKEGSHVRDGMGGWSVRRTGWWRMSIMRVHPEQVSAEGE